MSNAGSREMKRLKRDFSELRSDIGDLGHALSNLGAERGRTLYQQTAHQGLRLRDTGEAALGSAQYMIRSKPVSSALMVVAIGCIVGAAVTAYRKTHYRDS